MRSEAPDLDELLSVALAAASRAAEVHGATSRAELRLEHKRSPTDLVTQVDRDAEAVLVDTIRAARPRDGIVGEEGTDREGESGVCWILDPLDGTTNFVYGYPAYAVSIGVLVEGRRALGVVADTHRDLVYSGIVGRGASCDGRPLSVGCETRAELALLGTGFLPDAGVRAEQGRVLAALLPRVRDVRRSGSAALDLVSVASGALDVYFEFGLGAWDIAGGAAIAEAAGARVLELTPTVLPAPLVVAGNPALVEAISLMLIEAGAARA